MFDRLLSIPDSFVTPDGKRPSKLAYLFLVMLCVAFFTPGIVTMPPTDRDESSFAQASKQMIETGNYTDIRLQKEPRYKKPIGIYWLQSVSVQLLNPHHLNEIWAYRVPSFIGATIAVVITAAIGSLLFSPIVGLVAAMMMAGCVLLNVEARLAKTDAALLASVMVAMYGMARAYLGQVSGWRVPLAFWTSFAAGVLIKGPIILIPILGVLLWIKIFNKNVGWFRSLKPLPGFVYALILVLPWFIAISLQSHGAFMQQSAGNDMLHKLWQGQNRGIMPPGLHALALPIMFFPFPLFVAFALPDIWKNRKDDHVKFLLGWAVPTWLVFELSLTKLPHYVLPAYPAVALLAAKFLIDGLPTVANTTRRFAVALVIGLWLMIGIGFAAAFALLPAFVDQHYVWQQIAAGVVIILAQGAALLLLPKQKTASPIILTIASLVFMTVTFGITIPGLKHIWMSRQIAEAETAIAPCPNTTLVATGYHEPSLAFMAGTDTIMAMGGADAAKELMQDRCRVAAVGSRDKDDFLAVFKDKPQPKEETTVEGLNSGHGSQASMTLYTWSQP